MWTPTLEQGSNHQGYNNIDIDRYNRQDCSRTPTAQATGLKDGKRQFHRNPWNGVYSPWDLRETVDITQTCRPLVHYPHVEGNSDRGPHPPNRTMLLVRSISFHQDPIKASRAEKIQCPLRRTKRFWRRPKHHIGESLNPGVSLPTCTQEAVPIDPVGNWITHLLEDRKTSGTGVLLVKRHILDMQHQWQIL